mmetsp:Transcript_44273/g.116361  ORF Transcript_44273/g.116361 Transcript_44273/m.116361 type:complete len:101 (-) Transcript_44273:74-376(-)
MRIGVLRTVGFSGTFSARVLLPAVALDAAYAFVAYTSLKAIATTSVACWGIDASVASGRVVWFVVFQVSDGALGHFDVLDGLCRQSFGEDSNQKNGTDEQ